MTESRKPEMLPDELNRMIRGFQASRVILTGIELDIFSTIGNGASAEEIAVKISAEPRATGMLLNALTSLELLEKDGGVYKNGEWADRFLREGADNDWRAALMHTAHLWKTWSTLTDCVREGTAINYREMKERGEEWTEPFIAAMHKNTELRAPLVVGKIDLTGVNRLLDLGGGSGGYALQFARARKDLQVTVFDLPTVTPLTHRYAEQAGVGDRIETTDGDLRTDDYGSDYDLVFISAICHMLDEQANVEMFRKAHSALAPGGRVVVQDFIMNEAKSGPPMAALFALNMLVGTERGNTYSVSEYFDMLRDAGFTAVEKVELPGPTDLIIGTR